MGDPLRPTHQFVEASGSEVLTTRTVYGESLANPEVLNMRGRAYRVYDGAGVQTAVAYDFKGGLLAAERQLGVDYTQTLDWSGLSELEDVSDLEVAAASMLESEVFRTEGTFDALGRPTTQTTPDGTVVRLAYNEAALLEGVSANVRGAASETAFVSNIDYDAKGRRTLIAYGNGTETSYAYDDITRRLTRLRTTDATRTFQDLAYTYDAVGNIVEIGDAAQDDVYFGGAVVTATQRYEYDALYRLTHAEGREHAGQNAAQPTEFGASPSLHPQDGTAMRTYAEQYVYDVVGNILSMQHTAASGNWTRRYQYAANGNRLQANSAPGDAVGVYSHGYTHDAHGNMTAMPHLSAVTWNHADQMRSADLGGGGTAYFVYDAAGQRVRKVRVNLAGTQTYERVYLGAYELYRERTSGALQLERETLHIADDGGRMCDVETRTVESGAPVAGPTTHHRYQYSNHLGSASLELTASAEVISYEEYHPYGTSSYRAVNSSIDVSGRRYRYTGKERDEETGLGYHGARYYACWLGRWTASDPIGLGDGVNRYAYVSGRPILVKDPSGACGKAIAANSPPMVGDVKESIREASEAAERAERERNTLAGARDLLLRNSDGFSVEERIQIHQAVTALGDILGEETATVIVYELGRIGLEKSTAKNSEKTEGEVSLAHLEPGVLSDVILLEESLFERNRGVDASDTVKSLLVAGVLLHEFSHIGQNAFAKPSAANQSGLLGEGVGLAIELAFLREASGAEARKKEILGLFEPKRDERAGARAPSSDAARFVTLTAVFETLRLHRGGAGEKPRAFPGIGADAGDAVDARNEIFRAKGLPKNTRILSGGARILRAASTDFFGTFVKGDLRLLGVEHLILPPSGERRKSGVRKALESGTTVAGERLFE